MWYLKFPPNNWTAFLKTNGNPLQIAPTDLLKFIRELVEETVECLKKGQTGKAVDRISLGCVLDKSEFLPRLKKSGMLRHSSYIKSNNPVVRIAKHFLDNRHLFNLTSVDISYFESLQNLESFAREMKHIFIFISQTLVSYKVRKTISYGALSARVSIVKSLVALNDYAFLTRPDKDPGLIEWKDEEPTIDIPFSMEERSDGISLLLSMIDELIRIEQIDLVMIDEEFIISKQSENLVIKACSFKAYKEVEILIETLGYVCKKKGKQLTITYESDDRTFRSLELSYIISHVQKQADALWIKQAFNDLPSIEELAKEINAQFPDIVVLKTDPYIRFTLNLPVPIIEAISKEAIGYWREEYGVLEYIQNEMSLPLTDLGKYEIVAGLNLYDFMKISRAFEVLQIIYSERLKELETEENHMVVLNSILCLLDIKNIHNYFNGVIPADKISKYLEIMAWEAGKKEYLDLQYTPILQKNNHYLISLSVMRHSIMVRNVMASLAKTQRNGKAAQMELLEQVPQQLKDVFSKQGFTCFTDLKVTFKGLTQSNSDIDFFAYKDGHVFIGECKDVLDSIDPFEYRRVNDNLIKAASQLDYIKSAISDPQFLNTLSARLKIDLSKVKEFHHMIIPTARKMYGHSVGGYPVRYMHELTAFIKEGIWNYKLPGGNLHAFELWKDKEFQVTDLIEFCSPTGPHNELIKALVKIERQIDKNVNEFRYVLDLKAAFENLKKRYKFTENSIDPTPITDSQAHNL